MAAPEVKTSALTSQRLTGSGINPPDVAILRCFPVHTYIVDNKFTASPVNESLI